MSVEAMDLRSVPAARRRPRFFLWMSLACAAVPVCGFGLSYLMPMTQGKFAGNPVVHIHATVFSCWTLYFIYQSWLVGQGQVARHRSVGLIGISLATLMTVLGVMVSINMGRTISAFGHRDGGEAFIVVPLFSILMFAVLLAIAIVKIKRPETHKRLMLLAYIGMLGAAVTRIHAFIAPSGPPPPFPPSVWGGNGDQLIANVLVIPLMFYDKRMTGRIQPVTLIGTLLLFAIPIIGSLLSTTPLWHTIAAGFLSLADQKGPWPQG